jgi:hypothetical protein
LPLIAEFYDNVIQFDVIQTNYPASAIDRKRFFQEQEEESKPKKVTFLHVFMTYKPTEGGNVKLRRFSINQIE